MKQSLMIAIFAFSSSVAVAKNAAKERVCAQKLPLLATAQAPVATQIEAIISILDVGYEIRLTSEQKTKLAVKIANVVNQNPAYLAAFAKNSQAVCAIEFDSFQREMNRNQLLALLNQ